MLEYNKANIPNAKRLRKEMTPWERKLWNLYLSDYPIRFQRQKAIGSFIVDFYCAKACLALELDGSGHYEPDKKQADCRRTKELESQGLKIIRICNSEIDKNFEGVCQGINMAVEQSLPQSASPPAPSSEGAEKRLQTMKQITIYTDGGRRRRLRILRPCAGARPYSLRSGSYPHKITDFAGTPKGNPGPGGWGAAGFASAKNVPTRSPLARQPLGDDKAPVTALPKEII